MSQPFPVPAANTSAHIGGERYRPQYHFTPHRNWMNDPNGLIFFEGEYHLFYQYNPHGKDWGHMSWGHAVSADLVQWEELPVAIPETDQMIFSGCCVIDWHDLSGLGDGSMPPMLAFFTAHDEGAKRQTQHLAYSLDRGRTFRHYVHNPIIDLGIEHFRDPKVFWHADTRAWIMAVALPREHKVQFYRSVDLLEWEFASAFGPAGAVGGQWECPDIVQVPVDGHPGEHHWVLKVDVDDNAVDGGSGAQYFVGHFDGTAFTIDAERGTPDGAFVDFGPDFYAAVSWSDLPPEQPGPVWIGWMSNHQTGKDYPTDPWRGAQSLPRTLFLFAESNVLKLGQRPVAAVEAMLTMPHDSSPQAVEAGESIELGAPATTFARRITVVATPDARFSLALVADGARVLSLDFDRESGTIVFDRAATAGEQLAGFARSTMTTIPAQTETLLDIYFDGCLAEIFVDRGSRVYSACLFPKAPIAIRLACAAGRIAA